MESKRKCRNHTLARNTEETAEQLEGEERHDAKRQSRCAFRVYFVRAPAAVTFRAGQRRRIARVRGSSAQGTLCSGGHEAHSRSLARQDHFPGGPGCWRGSAGGPSLPPRPASPQPWGPAHLRGPHRSGAHSVALPGAKAPEPRGRARRPPPEPGHCAGRGEAAERSHRAVADAHVRTAPGPAGAPPPRVQSEAGGTAASREL